MGLLTQLDATQHRKWFNEMANLLGWTVGYQYPLGDQKTIHSEPNMEMSNPISVDIIFNENPTMDTLKKHGWVTEIGEQKPVIAQVPFDIPHLQRYSRFIIPPVGSVIDARTFEVTAISSILEYPDCWTVKLAPVYKTIQNNETLQNENNVTIDVTATGSQDIKPKRKEEANYEFPEGKINKKEGYMIHHQENPGPEYDNGIADNVLGKDFDDFDNLK